jgi:hypothetical protein
MNSKFTLSMLICALLFSLQLYAAKEISDKELWKHVVTIDRIAWEEREGQKNIRQDFHKKYRFKHIDSYKNFYNDSMRCLHAKVVENSVSTVDFNATLACALGLDIEKEVFSPDNRPFTIARGGKVVKGLMA